MDMFYRIRVQKGEGIFKGSFIYTGFSPHLFGVPLKGEQDFLI